MKSTLHFEIALLIGLNRWQQNVLAAHSDGRPPSKGANSTQPDDQTCAGRGSRGSKLFLQPKSAQKKIGRMSAVFFMWVLS